MTEVETLAKLRRELQALLERSRENKRGGWTDLEAGFHDGWESGMEVAIAEIDKLLKG